MVAKKGEVELRTVLWRGEDGRMRMRFVATKPEAGEALRELFCKALPHTKKENEGDIRTLVLTPAYPGSPWYPQDSVPFEIFLGYD